MSDETVDEPVQREPSAEAARGRSHKRIYLGVGGVVVALAVIVGAVAFTLGEDDGATPVPTEPTAKPLDEATRLEACNKLLDLETNAPFPGPGLVAAIGEFAAAAAASGDPVLTENASTYGDIYVTSNGFVSSEVGVKAHDDLIAHCRSLGGAGLNPVFVAPSAGPTPRVDLRAYGTEQLLEPVDRLPSYVRVPRGRDMSPVQLAVSNRGGYVMAWTYNQGLDNPHRCLAHGSERGGGSTSCPRADDTQSVPAESLRVAAVSSSTLSDPVALIEVSDMTAFVVFEAPGQRFVQRPAAGVTVFVWQLASSANVGNFTARAYDADGQAFGCATLGTASLDQRVPAVPTTCL